MQESNSNSRVSSCPERTQHNETSAFPLFLLRSRTWVSPHLFSTSFTEEKLREEPKEVCFFAQFPSLIFSLLTSLLLLSLIELIVNLATSPLFSFSPPWSLCLLSPPITTCVFFSTDTHLLLPNKQALPCISRVCSGGKTGGKEEDTRRWCLTSTQSQRAMSEKKAEKIAQLQQLTELRWHQNTHLCNRPYPFCCQKKRKKSANSVLRCWYWSSQFQCGISIFV